MIIANPIYDEEYVTDDLHKLDYKTSKNPLVQKIVRRLANAASNEEIRRLMDAEDSFDRIMNKELQEKNDTIEEQAKAIEDLKRALDDMKKQLGL